MSPLLLTYSVDLVLGHWQGHTALQIRMVHRYTPLAKPQVSKPSKSISSLYI